MTTLRRVLDAFEQTETPLRLDQLSRSLDLDRATLENMIQHWVRKGRIREVDGPQEAACNSCGVKNGCPFVVQLPRRYVLVRPEDSVPVTCADPAMCCPAGKRRQ